MSEEGSRENRRSTRLSISIPIVISGVDADGNSFHENVRTLIVNKHGGKIATARHLVLGSELLITNPAMGVSARTKVIWLGTQTDTEDKLPVAVQLFQAQNIWGIAFPPEDWTSAE